MGQRNSEPESPTETKSPHDEEREALKQVRDQDEAQSAAEKAAPPDPERLPDGSGKQHEDDDVEEGRFDAG